MSTFLMTVGLPYSGKSAHVEGLREKFGVEIHSSDMARVGILGNIQDQTNNQIASDTLHRRITSDLPAGKDAIYDTTNINYKRRIDLLNRLSEVKYQKVCIVMATSSHECEERSKYCEHVVSHEVLVRMYENFWIPYWYGGWDVIELVYPDNFELYSVSDLSNCDGGLSSLKQDNPHYIFTVGHHCIATYGLVSDGSAEPQEAALPHDIGKSFTKSFVNSKGEITEIAHYYECQHVSAYDSLFYSGPSLNRLYIANIIQWHTCPFEPERDSHSSKAQKWFKKFVGNKLYSDVTKLHAADIEAKGT